MRFQIAWNWKGYKFHLEGKTVIQVKHASVSKAIKQNQKFIWTWLDGKEYALAKPERAGPECYSLIADKQNLGSGYFETHGMWRSKTPQKHPCFVWDLRNDGVVVNEIRSGLNVIRKQSDGKTLAYWRYQSGFGKKVDVVCRPSLPRNEQSIIAGLILAHMDLDLHD